MQLGVGSSKGAEAIVHSVRTYIKTKERSITVKLDFQNAFNSHKRGTMLSEIKEHVPELYPLLYEIYRSPTPLMFGSESLIWSECGCRQGDVAAPVAFSLLLQPLLKELRSEVCMAYLDDVTCCDSNVTSILDDIDRVIAYESLSGLKLNPSKCEIYMEGFDATEALNVYSLIEEKLPGVTLVEKENFELLGAAMLEEGIEPLLEDRADTLSTMYERLPLVSSHTALHLLQRSMGVQRLIYFLRTSPAYVNPSVCKEVDQAQLKALEHFLNLSLTADAGTQLQLPIALGGLGIRSAESLAIPCFLASAYGSTDAVRQSLNDPNLVPHGLEEALSKWTQLFGPPPDLELRDSQSQWDEIAAVRAFKSLLREDLSAVDKARLGHVSCKEAGYFLQATPSPLVGTHLSNEHLRAAVCLRLGLPLFEEHSCACGMKVDPRGLHKLSCKSFSLEVNARHNQINDVLSRALIQAGVPNRKEPMGLSPTSNIRPDGLTVMPWSSGKSLIWDVTVHNTYADSYVQRSSRDMGFVARDAEKLKRFHYFELFDRYIFVPFVIETSGFWGAEALEFTRQIGERISQISGDVRATSFLRQRVAIEAVRGTSQLMLQGMPHQGAFHELFEMYSWLDSNLAYNVFLAYNEFLPLVLVLNVDTIMLCRTMNVSMWLYVHILYHG